MSKFEELQQKITELQSQLEELKTEDMEEKEWPQIDDIYYTVFVNGSVQSLQWDGSSAGKRYLATGNVHCTYAEAVAYHKWLTSPATHARRKVEACEGFNPRGDYGIYLLHTLIWVGTKSGCGVGDGCLRFSSTDSARAAIAKLGEETIKLALR